MTGNLPKTKLLIHSKTVLLPPFRLPLWKRSKSDAEFKKINSVAKPNFK